jgi:FkbM family methyltransferase
MRIVHPSMTSKDLVRSAAAATLVTSSATFLRYETVSLAGPRAITYSLRRTRASVVIRHGTLDVPELEDVFRRGVYRPAAPLLSALHGQCPSPRILDLGAHTGLPALGLLQQAPGARLISVEPDPMNLIILRRSAAANPYLDWRIVEGGIGDGTYLRGAGYARLKANTREDDRRETSPVVDALAMLETCDLARINTQGAEWRLMEDPRFRAAAPRALIMECHRRGCSGDDPAIAGRHRLRELGYATAVLRKPRGGAVVINAWKP